MSYLSKLTVKTVVRTNKLDPVIQRRQKLISATEEQLKVVKFAMKGESYEVLRKAWAKNEQGEKVLVAAHGNSLRALIMVLDGLSEDAITKLNLATGAPVVYELNNEGKVLSKKMLIEREAH